MSSTSMLSKVEIMYLRDFHFPKPSEFPATLIDFCNIPKSPLRVEQLDRPHVAVLGWSEKDHTAEERVGPHRGEHAVSQIARLLSLHAFQISNNLSTGSRHGDTKRFSDLVYTLKHVAKTSSSWKGILRVGPTSRALIEKLFDFSIMTQDRSLAELMLQIGADANQQVFDPYLRKFVSALDYCIGRARSPVTKLLLDSGAACGQTRLKHAIMAGDLDTADRMLETDQSLDVDFDYLATVDQRTVSLIGQVKVEKATLLSLLCLDVCTLHCVCRASSLASNESHSSHCPRYASFVILEFLLRKGATINLDTMILASFKADAFTLRLLMQHGGKVDGFNIFGFSCLDAASLRNRLRYDVFSLLLASGATTNIPQTHHALGFRVSLLHRLVFGSHLKVDDICDLHSIVDLLINSGADIDYRARQLGSPFELALAHEKFLWSVPVQHFRAADLIAQSKAESPLEYAIVLSCESIALTLVNRGCQLTGREIALAAKMGTRLLFDSLIERDRSGFDDESTRKTCLRLALRSGHETIVCRLLEKGVEFGGHDIIDALQDHGISVLSTKMQIELIRATPDLDRLQIFGLSLLELCFLKFRGGPIRDILSRFPGAYDSGALAAILIRSLTPNIFGGFYFTSNDLQAFASRRTESNCDWEKENKALLVAAIFHRPDILHILATRGTACAMKTMRIPREDFSSFLELHCFKALCLLDPTRSLGCRDWVSCSPIMGIALAPSIYAGWDASEVTLDHLLDCGYEPDALTVVMAAAKGNLRFLRRLQRLENWRSILSIDDDSRPPWCPTALQVAASNDNEAMAEFLLDAGTSVNEAPADRPIRNRLPRTALQAVVEKGNMRLLNRLLDSGACVNASAAEDSGATALQLACIHGYLTISLRLLELGADVNARGAQKHGRTALEGAAEHGRIDTIQLLLNHGACTDGVHREQYLKAVLYAEYNRHFAAAALLKEHREWTAEDEECYKSFQSGGVCNSWKDACGTNDYSINTRRIG